MSAKTKFDPIDLFLNLNSTFLLFLIKCFFGCFCLFKRIFEGYLGHGKSPWFSASQFFWLFGPDWLCQKLGDVDGAEFIY